MEFSDNIDVIKYLESFNNNDINYSINELMRCRSCEKEEIIDYIIKLTRVDSNTQKQIKISLCDIVNLQ